MGSVLVVEDDRRSADLLRVYLEDAGYAVSIARDGVEGLELAGRLHPAAVILDILLPRLNGWDLLAQLKSDPATSEIPVVIVSMTDEQGAGFALGATDYLVKPVDRARLLGAMSRCVSPRRERRTLVAIDDDPVDLDLLEAVLAPEGWRVVRATGGEEGVRVVRKERPAVVVLDLLMPDVDGFAVVEQLRADPLVGDVPVVVLTSKEMTRADRERLAGQISFLAQKGTSRRPSSSASSDAWPAPSSRRSRRHDRSGAVLIIEDNARNLKLARDILNHAGYETLEAENAEDGLELARARHPGLVLMDVQLPGMDGVQALVHLRADPATADIPVIALTAFAMKADRERFIAAGFDQLHGEAARHPRAAPTGRRDASRDGKEAMTMPDDETVLVVDDLPQNVRLLEAILAPRGYRVASANSGREALERVAAEPVDLVLLDILMPEMDGYEVCRALRAEPATSFLPVVMITASGEQEKVAAIEAGADDFIAKPFDQAELLARVRSLLRIKHYHDTIEAQAAELAAWNRELEQRVSDQVDALERMGRLRRFLSPQLAELVVSSGDDSFLESHRREITVVFCDLRGFTSFAETVEPEDLMAVLGEYHAALGDLVHRFDGTLERFTGDGLMVIFNDPLDCPDAPERAVRMALAMRARVAELAEGWSRRGYDLDFGVGIAQGHATLGRIGFEGRSDYTAIGSVTNLAARLCARRRGGRS